MKNKIVPIVSVIVGIIAFALTFQYLSGEKKKLEKLKEQISKANRYIEVAGAARDIPGGTKLAENDLDLIRIPEAFAPEDVVTRNEGYLILGRKVMSQVTGGKPIVWSNLEGGGGAAEHGLSQMITHRMRAISLSIGGASAVSGMVQPNDRVDVLGTFSFPSKAPGEMETVTLTVLQDVTVLATGQTLAKDKTLARKRMATTAYSTVTLEVTLREAELLVFAQQMRGNLTLALRNPSDTSFETELPEINFQKVKEELAPLNQERQKTIRGKMR